MKPSIEANKAKNLKDLLTSSHDDQRECTRQCMANYRYTSGIGGTCYGYRRQQFGRWHEEPAFGSRYAFNGEENRLANSVTNTPNIKTRNLGCGEQTLMSTTDIDDQLNGHNCTALIKSSSIDTIAVSEQKKTTRKKIKTQKLVLIKKNRDILRIKKMT